MGYARLIGRVGALAVALGVGSAVAFPVIGHAAPDSGTTTTDDSPPPADATPPVDDSEPPAEEPSDGPEDVDADADDDALVADGAADPGADADTDLDVDADAGDPGDELDESDVGDDATPTSGHELPAEPDASEQSEDPGLDDQSGADVQLADLDEDEPDLGSTALRLASTGGAQVGAVQAAGPVEEFSIASTAAAASASLLQASAPIGVVKKSADLLTAALQPFLAADQDGPATPNLGLLAALGFTRREAEQNLLAATPLASVQQIGVPQLLDIGDIGSVIEDFFIDVLEWLKLKVIWPYINNRTPVVASQQEVLDVNTQAQEFFFDAYDPDGNTMVFTVNGPGLPGAPEHGTVSVDGNTFTYTPPTGFGVTVFQDTFSYAVTDDTGFHFHGLGFFREAFSGHQNTATVTIFANGAPTDEITDEITVVSYNVAGLPWPLSSAIFPRYSNTQEIGNRLNEFADIANVQEDFAYHWWLIRDALFPAQTEPKPPTKIWPVGVPFSDGLNTLSSLGIRFVDRVAWDVCHADNCLTPKGLSYSELQLPGGQTVDFYNVHMNTGGGADTNANIEQLYAYIVQNSAGKAVIITGDFNERYSEQGQVLSSVLLGNGFTDAWAEQYYGNNPPVYPASAPDCDNGSECEQLDKIFYRSSPEVAGVTQVKLEQVPIDGYQNLGTSFENDEGEPLSDHRPVSVRLIYTVQNLYSP